MHLEILVEGQSDKIALSILLERIVGKYKHPHTWKIHAHRGFNKISRKTSSSIDLKNKNLSYQLLHKLKSYNKESETDFSVVVLVDSDNNNCKDVKEYLLGIADSCKIELKPLFCIAVKDLESWFLGDKQALKKAYPNFDKEKMDYYNPCYDKGNWKYLADVIYPGGAAPFEETKFKRTGKRGEIKKKWAKNICQYMDVENNKSPSFCFFRDRIRNMIKKHKQPIPSRPNA